MEYERKGLSVELKASGAGQLEAVFATIRDASGNQVVDSDGDVYGASAFDNGSEVVIGAWGHMVNQLPIGKGRIVVTANEAKVDGQLFLDTSQGEAAYRTLKGLGGLAEWSFVFEVLKASAATVGGKPVRVLEQLKVYSVDPVLAGAGVNTRTTRLKAQHARPSGAWAPDEVAEVQAELKRSEELLAKEQARAELKRFEALTAELRAKERIEVHGENIVGEVKLATLLAVQRGAERLEIPRVPVKFFRWSKSSEQTAWGFTDLGEPAIWVQADLGAKQAAWTAYHEMYHRAGNGNEDACDAFAFQMLERWGVTYRF